MPLAADATIHPKASGSAILTGFQWQATLACQTYHCMPPNAQTKQFVQKRSGSAILAGFHCDAAVHISDVWMDLEEPDTTLWQHVVGEGR